MATSSDTCNTNVMSVEVTSTALKKNEVLLGLVRGCTLGPEGSGVIDRHAACAVFPRNHKSSVQLSVIDWRIAIAGRACALQMGRESKGKIDDRETGELKSGSGPGGIDSFRLVS